MLTSVAQPQESVKAAMSEPNSRWRVNREGMEQCCYYDLLSEMHRRKGLNEPLMVNGDILKCSTCNSEMVCDPSLNDQRLRWRWKGDGNG